MYQTLSPELCRQLADDRRQQLERTAHVVRLQREARRTRRERRRHRPVRT